MPVDKETKNKANRYFFTKVAVNIVLMIIGTVAISIFLIQMQHKTALYKQKTNNEQSLADAISIMEQNAEDAAELSRIFHDGNQDMLDDLKALFDSGLFSNLQYADDATRSEVTADMVARSGVDYLFLMFNDGRIALSPYAGMAGKNLVSEGYLTIEHLSMLTEGTKKASGNVVPVLEKNKYGEFYFYSLPYSYLGNQLTFVLGADASDLQVQIDSLTDVSVVLNRAVVGNNGFLFAVNKSDSTFLYYENGKEVLTGKNALEAGLSEAALNDGYSGIEYINGVKYYCTSKTYRYSTVVCAVADTDAIYSNDKYVIFWSVLSFIMVMMLCLVYAIIIRNDFVRNEVETEKRIFRTKKGNTVIFDKSIFNKVFPLMIAGVLAIFGLCFFNQTLLEISESVDDSVVALEEVSNRYEESISSRESIQSYYNERFLAKAKLISFLIEEDPSVLNSETDRFYSYYDEQGIKHYITDDEGNRLKSVPSNAKLIELCEANDIESVYIYDEDGHTIATSTPNWFFTVSHNPKDQSYPFLDIIDGRKDELVQETMVNDIGESGQYIGVAFTYYTTKDENGNTVYVSRYAYQTASEENRFDVTPHRAMLQIGLQGELTDKILSSTDLDYIFSTDTLSGGFMVLFDNSEDHIVMYSPYEARVGMKAADIGVPVRAFNGSDYYGFTRINGITYFQYFRFSSGYYVATAIPKSGMYQSRGIVSAITSITSLILILILSGTVIFTTEEEEKLYATMSASQEEKGLNSAIFSIILPSGKRVSTVDAESRWSNRVVKWNDKGPEQKLLFMIGVICAVFAFYLIITVLGVNVFYKEGSIIRYIISGNWDRGPNIFALSASLMVIVFVSVAEALFRLPVKLITSLLGARGETIGHLLLSIIKYGGAIGVLFYCLYLFGVDSTSLIASAGLLSLVIGLGAQSLIKDIIAGIFIVFEGEFRVGDIVTIGGYRGTVVDIGLRTTKIVGGDRNIKIFNNSDISGVLNMTKEASVAFVTISIEYGQDLDYVEAVLKRDLPGLMEENNKILEEPQYLGVQNLGDSGVDIAIIAKCNEKDIKGVVRFMNAAVLRIFYKNGINVPFPNVTVSNLDTSGRKTMMDFEHPASSGNDFFENNVYDERSLYEKINEK